MTWLVTGASSGVGRVLAVALAGAGHRVLLTARNATLLQDTQIWCPGSEVLPADLADPASVGALAIQVLERTHGSGLDGIVHAAGVMLWNSLDTPAGWSLVPAVNALAPWLLTHRLEPALLASTHPRVLFIAGASFTLNGIVPGLPGWKGSQPGRGMTLALEAASAKVLMAREFHRRWQGSGSAFAFHPGFVKSHLADGLPFPLSFLGCVAQGVLATRSANGEFLALDPRAPALAGNLVDNRRAYPACPVPEDAAAEAEFLSQLPV